MTYEESAELYKKIGGISKSKLVRLHYRALKKLNALSQICDVDDVLHALKEQQSAQRKVDSLAEQVKYAKRYMIGALRRRGVECDKSFTLPQLTDLMIESDKNTGSPD